MYIYILFKCKYNVSIYDYSFKYICLICYLKLPYYCLTCSAMSNMNSAEFREMLLEFESKTDIEIIWF